MCNIIVFIYLTEYVFKYNIKQRAYYKLLLIMQRIPIDEIVFCRTNKQFHVTHVTVVDPDSSDSSRLYPNERYTSI